MNKEFIKELIDIIKTDAIDDLTINYSNQSLVIKIKNKDCTNGDTYNIIFNEDFTKVESMNVDIIFPSGDNTLWENNGYPEQGCSMYKRLNSLIDIVGSNPVLESYFCGSAYRGRVFCTLNNGTLHTYITSRPSTRVPVQLVIINRTY